MYRNVSAPQVETEAFISTLLKKQRAHKRDLASTNAAPIATANIISGSSNHRPDYQLEVTPVREIEHIYINGEFVVPQGRERLSLTNPATEEMIGYVRLGNDADVKLAVAAAKHAFPKLSATRKAERIQMLQSLRDAIAANPQELVEAMTEEYGAPAYFTAFSVQNAAAVFDVMAETVAAYDFDRIVGRSSVKMIPRGVIAAITPWNSNFGFIATKLAHAIGSGSPLVIKPAEQSAIQTDLFARTLHKAGLPAGVFNMVNGTGPVVGAALTAHPDIATMSFTRSLPAAKIVQRAAINDMKRVVLELGGKGADHHSARRRSGLGASPCPHVGVHQ